MNSSKPVPPTSLSALAREVLDLLATRPAAVDIVLGDGLTLAHDLDYRATYGLSMARHAPEYDIQGGAAA